MSGQLLTVDYLLLLPLKVGAGPVPSTGGPEVPVAPPRVVPPPPRVVPPPRAEPKAVAALVALVRLFFTVAIEVVAVREYVAMNGELAE